MIDFIKKYYKIVVWTFVIAYLCFSSADNYKSLNWHIPHMDKLIHFVMFFVAGVLLKALYLEAALYKHFYFTIGYVIYAGITELVQLLFIPSRSGSLFDFIVDVGALFAGLTLFKYLPKYVKKVMNY